MSPQYGSLSISGRGSETESLSSISKTLGSLTSSSNLTAEKCLTNLAATSSLAAYDFDGDGQKEVFYQNGDEFSLTVYGFKGRKLEELGSVTYNNGLIITDDGLCASRYGSQGLCDMFRIENGKMEVSKDEDIDPLLFSSDDFRNLRYSFKDTSREDRQIRPVTIRDKRQKDILLSALLGRTHAGRLKRNNT